MEHRFSSFWYLNEETNHWYTPSSIPVTIEAKLSSCTEKKKNVYCQVNSSAQIVNQSSNQSIVRGYFRLSVVWLLARSSPYQKNHVSGLFTNVTSGYPHRDTWKKANSPFFFLTPNRQKNWSKSLLSKTTSTQQRKKTPTKQTDAFNFRSPKKMKTIQTGTSSHFLQQKARHLKKKQSSPVVIKRSKHHNDYIVFLLASNSTQSEAIITHSDVMHWSFDFIATESASDV